MTDDSSNQVSSVYAEGAMTPTWNYDELNPYVLLPVTGRLSNAVSTEAGTVQLQRWCLRSRPRRPQPSRFRLSSELTVKDGVPHVLIPLFAAAVLLSGVFLVIRLQVGESSWAHAVGVVTSAALLGYSIRNRAGRRH